MVRQSMNHLDLGLERQEVGHWDRLQRWPTGLLTLDPQTQTSALHIAILNKYLLNKGVGRGSLGNVKTCFLI